MDNVQQIVDKIHKQYFGSLVAALLRSFRTLSLETAEDCVQDSFSAAIVHWEARSIPVNTVGWIYKASRNKALNTIRRDKRIEGLTTETSSEVTDVGFSESVLDDYQLRLLFACAHPDLAPKVQVVITLKYVANLKVEAIARSLALTIDGVDKILIRARQKIKEEKILLAEPDAHAYRQRLQTVHKIIYLIFNEGYKSSWGNEVMREELCEEALIMNKALLESGLSNFDTKALHALMLFNAARFASRHDENGDLVDLENQDRSRWNQELIALANNLLHRAKTKDISHYHIEASIAWVHCISPDFQSTDWKLITDLYAALMKLNVNPFVEMNFAIALYYAGEKRRSFEILDRLRQHPFLKHYYLLNAALGKFHSREGNIKEATHFLQMAYDQAVALKEKAFIRGMIEKCRYCDQYGLNSNGMSTCSANSFPASRISSSSSR